MSGKLVQNLTFKKSTEGVDPMILGKIIEKAYLENNRKEFKTKNTFSPSSIGYGQGQCPRYWFLAFNGAEFIDNNDAAGIASMENGTAAHTRMEELFRRTGILLESETELLIEDPPVRGFIDLVVDWNGEEVIGEFKTTRQEAFVNRQATMKPAGYHLLQILIYMEGKGAKHGFMLYENKNNQEILVIPVNMNDRNKRIIENTFDWMRTTYSNWQEGNLPTRPFRKNSKECKGCPLFKTCYDGPQGDVTIEALPIIKP
jgi:CRISPR/Cas system-associated exonuclease Cas4 (RecB family)